MRLFEDILREIEALISYLMLFEYILNGIEAFCKDFQGIRGLFLIISRLLEGFTLMWDVLKAFEAF
jgi:hypothetical protein